MSSLVTNQYPWSDLSSLTSQLFHFPLEVSETLTTPAQYIYTRQTFYRVKLWLILGATCIYIWFLAPTGALDVGILDLRVSVYFIEYSFEKASKHWLQLLKSFLRVSKGN